VVFKLANRSKVSNNHPRNLITSLVLVFPLFIAYQLGVLLIYPMINGADFLTRLLLQNLGLSRSAYLAYTALVAVLFGVAVATLRRRQHINLRVVVPVLLESAIYALTMGSAIVLVMTRLFGLDPHLASGWHHLASGISSEGIVTRMVMSIGAGVWEETVFRLALLTGIAVFLERALGLRRVLSLTLALAISSVLFSAVHHIPPYGDPLRIGVFTFRMLAGVFFGLLYWFRGFAVAVYTHALYDLYVLILRP
jgi:hypothetical protein